jgi:hypothetical protein
VSDVGLLQVIRLATQLSRAERSQLVAWLAGTLDEPSATPATPASGSLYGICADLGPGPTDEDIHNAREEMWDAIPREDIA